MISRLKRQPLRDVWKREAYDFTPWLRDNLDVLNEVLGFTLSGAEREHPTGNFSVDLVAEDDDGNSVAIENQLEASNHDHLGKVLTYLAAIDAKKAIWIVSEPKSEHIKAITWLNESGLADFYMVKVEAVSIDGSPPAPLLTLIVGPSKETKQAGERKQEFSERHELRSRFWIGLIERARTRTQLHSTVTAARMDNWLAAAAGKPGLTLAYVIRQHDVSVELWVDRGAGREPETLRLYSELEAHKADIETRFGEPLEWMPLENKRLCKVVKRIALGGYRDEEEWPRIQEAMVDSMIGLDAAFRPAIASQPG